MDPNVLQVGRELQSKLLLSIVLLSAVNVLRDLVIVGKLTTDSMLGFQQEFRYTIDSTCCYLNVLCIVVFGRLGCNTLSFR